MNMMKMGKKARQITDDASIRFSSNATLENRGLRSFNRLFLLLLLLTETSLLAILWPLPYSAQANEVKNSIVAQKWDFCRNILKNKDFEAAILTCKKSIAGFKKLDNRTDEAKSTIDLGLASKYVGQNKDARKHLEDGLSLAQSLNDYRLEAIAHTHLADVYEALGQTQKSQISRTKAKAYFKQKNVAHQKFNLGNKQFGKSQFREALQSWQEALTIYLEIGDRKGEGAARGSLGIAYFRLGDYQNAIAYQQQTLAISRDIGDRPGEAASLGNLGNIYHRLGEYQKAIPFHEQSLAIKREAGNLLGEANSLSNLGNAYHRLGEYQKAITFDRQSLAISRDIGNLRREAQSLGNLGGHYSSLGEYQKAIDFHKQSLGISRKIEDHLGESVSLGNLGNVYHSLGEYQKAIDFHKQELAISRNINTRLGEASSLGSLGSAYFSLGDMQAAIVFQKQSLAISQDIGYRLGEASSLRDLGNVYDLLGDYQKAIAFYQESLLLAQSMGAQETEGRSLSQLGLTFAELDNPELAIVFLKQSINIREQIRKNLKGLPQATQQSYTETVEDSYRRLADLLLQQDRILEAQAVLDLLKVQELDDYLRGVRGNGDQLDYLKPELEILARYQESQKSAIQLIQELDTLTQLANTGEITPAQTQRRNKLISLKGQLNDFLRQPEIQTLLAQLSQESGRESLNLTQLTALQDNLANVNGALLSPLILDDRLELVLTPPKGQGTPLRRTVPVKRTDLNKAILDLRLALQDPQIDPKPAAQKLYNWLIKPLEADLDQSQIETILYAPDGQLRYIPLAALHDGNQWLIERYPICNFTTTSSTDFDTQPQTNPKILAGAFADQAVTRTVSTATKNLAFQGLPFAGVEVKTLAQSRPDTTALIDNEFNLNRTLEEMDLHQIIHFATHAAFVPSNPESSFIVFGDGKNPNLFDIQNWDLSHVDLVVLSACETAVGGILGNGVEVLGLGYQFQTSGTKAVMASLWQVNDGSTQTLMNAFYEGLNANTTKGEALRQSQLALITGDYRKVGGKRASVKLKPTEKNNSKTSASDSLSHPYYWAPFILIGNGR